VGNHKPSFRNVDDAIRRRLHLIPFTFKAPPDKIDPRLSEKLKAEASGILAWMIQGCIEWQQTGLRPPEIVKESTDEYLGGEDSLQQWLDDCCDLGMGFTTSKALFKSWSEWAENAGEFVGTMKRLMAKLESRGVSTGQKHRGMRGCNGIQLKQVC
jgi:P4 family phage/plasmid primase-like protien